MKYKSFREQLLECLDNNNCIEVECIKCKQKNLICLKYKCKCSSRVCRNERGLNAKI